MMSSLESVWAYREDVLYPRLFGTMSRGVFPLGTESFERLSDGDIDPRWPHLGVCEYAPTAQRPSWLYVTSGGSTPWETEDFSSVGPDDYSWLGVEFVLETPAQADWPVRALQRLLAYHVLASCGRFGDTPGVDYGHRIPAGPIDGDASKLRVLAICQPDHYEATCQLDSGKFDFLHVVGITEAERDFAKSTSTDELIALLKERGAAPVTNPTRKSAV